MPLTTVHASSCPGTIEVAGLGNFSLVNALWEKPGVEAQPVDITVWDGAGSHAVVPQLAARTYFADQCLERAYDHSTYASFELLGKRLRYTVDLSGAGCGCGATFKLVPLMQNPQPSKCLDHYCDAAGLCGSFCDEVTLQESNMHVWHSTLRSRSDPDGTVGGLGGNATWVGPHDFASEDYSIGGSCIDTSEPFQVEASFPVNAHGGLELLEVTLWQENKMCSATMSLTASAAIMSQISTMLKEGVTPVISYGVQESQWYGTDVKGPCTTREKWGCSTSVRFYNFSVVPLRNFTKAASVNLFRETALSIGRQQAEKRPKPCVWGWRQAPECAGTFSFQGLTFQGCADPSSWRPWCSTDAVYRGNRRPCSSCKEASSSTTAPAQEGVPVRIPAQTGHYGHGEVCSWPVRSRSNVGEDSGWDSFELIHDGMGNVSLETFHGRFLGVEEDGSISGRIDDRSEAAISFEFVRHASGFISLRGMNGKFVEASASGVIAATGRSVGERTRFQEVGNVDGTISLVTWQNDRIVAEKHCASACFVLDASYRPLEMQGQPKVWVKDAVECQSACAAFSRCAFFTFYASDWTCHFADNSSSIRVRDSGATAGPAHCSKDGALQPSGGDADGVAGGSHAPAGDIPPASKELTSVLSTSATQDCEWPIRFDELAGADWDTFNWLHRRDGVLLESAHGRYLRETPEGLIKADGMDAQSMEARFKVLWNADGTFSLQTHQGKRIAAMPDGSLFSRESSGGPQEKFTVVAREAGRVSLRTFTGQSLVAARVCTPSCAVMNNVYLPSESVRVNAVRVLDASACQGLCASTPDCEVFTYLPGDRSCHLGWAPGARPPVPSAGASPGVFGPPRCDDMMVMWRFSDAMGLAGGPKQGAWGSATDAWSLVALAGLPGVATLLVVAALTRRRASWPHSARSMSRSGLLPVDLEESNVE